MTTAIEDNFFFETVELGETVQEIPAGAIPADQFESIGKDPAQYIAILLLQVAPFEMTWYIMPR